MNLRRFYLTAAALLLALSQPLAFYDVSTASGILDLGSPTDTLSPNPYFPLGNFHRVTAQRIVRGRVRVLLVSLSGSDIESWPVVKSLERFGSLSGVGEASQSCYTVRPDPLRGIMPQSGPVCTDASFDLQHARLASRYVILEFGSLTAPPARCSLAGISNAYWALFVRYDHVVPEGKDAFCRLWNATRSRGLSGIQMAPPLLLVGNYAQAGTQIVNRGDFEEALAPIPGSDQPGMQSGLPFDTIREDLATDRNPKDDSLVQDVNAEANIITALICHTNRGKPAAACDRSVIKTILKHVK